MSRTAEGVLFGALTIGTDDARRGVAQNPGRREASGLAVLGISLVNGSVTYLVATERVYSTEAPTTAH